MIQVPQGPPPFFNTPVPITPSITDHSFAGSANYYGNAAAYTTGFFRPGTTAQSVQGFHQGQLYQLPDQWNGTPPGSGRDRGGGGPNQMFPFMVLQVNAKDNSRPMLPTEICHFLPHVLAVIGDTGVAELQNTLDFMEDTGATTNTYKLSIMIDYCKRYPDHVKAMFDSRNGNYRPIPLAGAIWDATFLPREEGKGMLGLLEA